MAYKKLAICFAGDFPEGDKKNARLKSIATELSQNNWESTFISAFPTRFSEGNAVQQGKIWNKYKVVHAGNWSQHPKYRMLRILQILYCQLRFAGFLFGNRKKFDAFYFYTPQFIGVLPGLLLLRIFSRRIVVDFTDLHSSFLLRKVHLLEEWLVARWAPKLLVISVFLYKHFVNLRVDVKKFGILVHLERFNVVVHHIPFTIGYIGSYGAKDGIHEILEAFAVAFKRDARLRLRLIGKQNDNKVLSQIKKLNITSSVEVLGASTYEAIPVLLKECDTFIMNRNSSQFSETGYPIKLGEYFACNRPVLMSDGPGYSEDFSHLQEAIKYKVDDAQALADAIVFRYENEMLAWEVSQRGYDYAVAHFDSKKQVKKLVEILDEL